MVTLMAKLLVTKQPRPHDTRLTPTIYNLTVISTDKIHSIRPQRAFTNRTLGRRGEVKVSEMAAGGCTVQMSSIVPTSRGRLLQPTGSNRLPFSSYKMKLNLPTCRGLKIATLSSSPSSSSSSIARRSSRVVCQAETDQVLVVTDSSWQNLVIGSKSPVLVEFWAPWCGPCRMIAPVIDELAKEYAGKIVCCKVNTDDSPGIATEYGIRSIPTVLMFKNGEKRESVIGAVPKSTLTDTIEKYLNQ